MDKANFWAIKAYEFFKANNNYMKQAKLYLKFVNSDLTPEEYFHEQSETDNIQKTNATKEKWSVLKKRNFNLHEHERSHWRVFRKYGIDSQLYKKGRSFFVMDTNFKKVAMKNNYNKQKILIILKEMLRAPFFSREKMKYDYAFDLICYEILERNIKKFSLDDIKLAFSKYSW